MDLAGLRTAKKPATGVTGFNGAVSEGAKKDPKNSSSTRLRCHGAEFQFLRSTADDFILARQPGRPRGVGRGPTKSGPALTQVLILISMLLSKN